MPDSTAETGGDVTTRLERWRTITEAATPGPWAWEATGDKDNSWAVGLVQDEEGNTLSGQLEAGQGVIIEGVCESINGHLPDAEFIAEARAAMPPLLAAVDAALERHRGEPSMHDVPPKPQLYCTSCGVDDGWYNVPWPCPTVAAITAELTGAANPERS